MTGATWTDCTRVRDVITSGSPMSDSEINDVIDMVEAMYILELKLPTPTGFTFSSSNKLHLILRQAATLRAALICMASGVSICHRTIEDTYLNYNGIYTALTELDEILEGKGVRDAIVNGSISA